MGVIAELFRNGDLLSLDAALHPASRVTVRYGHYILHVQSQSQQQITKLNLQLIRLNSIEAYFYAFILTTIQPKLLRL